MVQCKDCGLKLSPKIEICPNCGLIQENQKKGGCLRTAFSVLLLSVVGLLAISLTSLYFHGGDRPYSSYKPEPVEDIRPKAKFIPYENLARNPKRYKGTIVVFKGMVMQTMEYGRTIVIRLKVGKRGFDSNIVWVEYRMKSNNEPRILENDTITIYGEFEGIKDYKSVLGQRVQIPSIEAEIVDR